MKLSQAAKIEYAVYPYKSKSVECTDYYKFRDDENEIRMMEAEFLEKPEVVHVFPLVREGLYDDHYLEVYIWDTMMYPASYSRYLIVDGYKMPEEQEEEFLDYMCEVKYNDPIEQISLPLYGNPSRMRRFIEDARRAFPQWHMIDYAPQFISEALKHCYFASHPGIRETLYKCELRNIAENLDSIPGYSLIGLTPSSVICGLPLKLLRIMNRTLSFYDLFDEEKIVSFRKAYAKYAGYIDYKTISKGQWMYLVDLVSPDGYFYGKRFNRTLYNRLESGADEYTLYAYSRFMNLREEFSEIKKFDIPDCYALEDAVEMLSVTRDYINDEYFNRRIKERKKKQNLEYAADGFQMVLPGSCLEFCIEALSQGSCLLGYLEQHALGETNILFLRKEDEPNKTYVTVEVKNGVIKQVYEHFNRIPSKDVFLFLEEYAGKKGLEYNASELIEGKILESVDGTKKCAELKAYVDGYNRRMSHPTMYDPKDYIQYEQMSLIELYPDLFPQLIWERIIDKEYIMEERA